jgi:membrane protease subunit HflK
MPWKEPGEKPREPRRREPWGQGHGHGGGPDFNDWWRKARRRLGPFGQGPLALLAVVIIVVVLWFLIGGWTVIGSQQVGVDLRFGRLQSVLQPGFHLRFPSPIDRIQKVDLGRTHALSDQTRFMTRDGQVAMVDYFVHYKITNAREYLFSNRNAHDAARNAAAVVVRAAIGTHTLAELRRHNGDGLGKPIREQLEAKVDHDGIGINVTEAGIQRVGVPSKVKQAFDGIEKTRENAKAAQATARADVAHKKANTQAQVASIKAKAAQYSSRVVANANARVARFEPILAQYRAAPQVTKHRLWLATMHDVLSNNRVIVNTGTASVIIQFPTRQTASGKPASAASSAPASSASAAVPRVPVTSGPAMHGTGP